MPKKGSRISTEIQYVKGPLFSEMNSGAKLAQPPPTGTWTGCDTFFTVECHQTIAACPTKIEYVIPPWLLEKIEKYGLPPWWESITMRRNRGGK